MTNIVPLFKFFQKNVNDIIFSKIDRIFYARHLMEPRPLFILGVPRSGTTLFYQTVVQNMQVTFFPAPMTYCYGLANGLQRLLQTLHRRPTVNYESHYGHVSGWLAPTEDANFWLQWLPSDGELGHRVSPDDVEFDNYHSMIFIVASLESIAKHPLAIKSLYLDMNAGLLARLFPNARFVHVHRNPITNCQSLLLGRQRQRNPNLWWSVKIPYYHRLLREPLWRQVCEQYFYTEKILHEDLKKYASNDRVFDVQYELFCREPNKVLDELERWLSPVGFLPYSDRRIPKEFKISDQLIISSKEVKAITDYLSYLESTADDNYK